THNTIINTNNNGINIFAYFSIPFLIPELTIQDVRNIKIANHKIGLKELPLKLSNITPNSFEFLPSNPLIIDCYIYSSVHPATAV
ncbi:MAG: hypothetical protein KAQ75_06000, partial [Bacteroidales bacterium]|nr:hypothetical protein [Bacteroidales bacterium]